MEILKPILKKLIKGYGRDLWWRLYGSTIKMPPLPVCVKSVLFICKGNICRSPFAEYKAKDIAELYGLNKLNIASAGLRVNKPESPPKIAIKAARKFDVKIHAHISSGLTLKMIEEYDLIIVVEATQLRMLRKKFPKYRHKYFLLTSFEKDNTIVSKGYDTYNIKDPYGKTLDIFTACYKRIEPILKNLILEITRGN
jgi:protein-tyrosine phosphatase